MNGGGAISLLVEVWDWQGDISNVLLESKDSGIIASTPYTTDLGAGSTVHSYLYDFIGVGGAPTTTGDLDLLITVYDPLEFGQVWFMDLLSTTNTLFNDNVYNCFMHTTNVSECPIPTFTSITPNTGEPGDYINNAAVVGTGFIDTGLTCWLEQGTAVIPGTGIYWTDTSNFTVDFDLTGALLGVYDLMVTNGCGNTSATGNGLFEVVCPVPTVTAMTPSSGHMGVTLDDALIQGTGFVDTGLTVLLRRTGQTDILGTDINVLNKTNVTADFNLTGAALGAWDVVLTNGCGETGTGTGLFTVTCPTPTVTNINPSVSGPTMSILATIDGTGFISGTSLAARLRKTGQTDIVGTGVTWINNTQIRCTFSATGVAYGMWNVVVTNGCGQTGTGVGLLGVTPCSSNYHCPTMAGYQNNAGPSAMYGSYGFVISKGSSNNYAFGRDRSSSNDHRMWACDLNGGFTTGVNTTFTNSTSDRIYPYYGFDTGANGDVFCICYDYGQSGSHNIYRLWRRNFNSTTGTWSGTTYEYPPWMTNYRPYYAMCLDNLGRPIVWTYYSTSYPARIAHWNGTSWTQVAVSLPSPQYPTEVRAMGWNPVQNHYIVGCYDYVGSYNYIVNLYAYNTSGVLQYQENDIFAFHQNFYFYPGIFVDTSSPNCRILVWGCTSSYSSSYVTWPVVRYDAYYTRLCQATLSTGDYRRRMGYASRYAGCYSQEFGRIEGVPNYYSNYYDDTNWFRLPSDW
jgi:hypothetical protein